MDTQKTAPMTGAEEVNADANPVGDNSDTGTVPLTVSVQAECCPADDESFILFNAQTTLDDNKNTDVIDTSTIEYTNEQKSATFNGYKQMESFLLGFVTQINSMSLTEEHTNTVYELSIKLVEQCHRLILSLMEDDPVLRLDALHNSIALVTETLAKHRTSFTRKQIYKSNKSFVAPEERVLGTRWEVLPIENSNLSVPRLIQCKFQYISIIETLKALFTGQNFRDTYFKFNSHKSFNDHECTEGEYTNICCGTSYKNNPLFSNDPTSIKIMLASDDFGVCNPLGSKASIHKVNAVYMVIRNMPEQYMSKLDNIQVVSLANADDLKTRETDFNDIWALINRDIQLLENTGIDIGNGIILKGSLCCLTFDTLGANMCLGYAEGSNTTYYCRMCETPKNVCQNQCCEDASTLRTKDSYEQNVQVVLESEKVQYTETKGIKRYCVLNDLKYFHMLDSPSQDPLHDLNEGVVRDLLRNFFAFLTQNKIITEKIMIEKMQYHDYGFLKKDVRPSKVLLDKANLNQSGSQIMCLLQNVPFIFHEFHDHSQLIEVWNCLISLIRISQIVYSGNLTEKDIVELEKLIELHLTLYQKCFHAHLKPKHHFLLHYARIIRTMGPIKFLSTIRFESKHQQLKKLINKSRNFINITKTMAQKHQAQMQFKTNTYTDAIVHGKKKLLSKEVDLDYFQQVQTVFEIKWFKINSYRYAKGIFIQYGGHLYIIERCFVRSSETANEFYLSCHKAEIIGMNAFFNSLMIKKIDESNEQTLEYSKLKIRNVYEPRYIRSEIHIISDDISLNHMRP